MTAAEGISGTADPVVRQQRLASRVQGLRARGGRIGADDRWMLVVGGTLLPLGVLLVLLGWLGASRTVLVFEQVPYLISGGVLGLALVFAGGFVYFAYWLTVLVRESRSARNDLTAVLLRMEALLEQGPAVAPPARTARPRSTTAAALVATRSGTMLHRPDCVAVDGRDGLRQVTATTPGLSPCRLCEPLVD